MNVYDQAHQLATAIKESEEFVRYYSSNANWIKEKLFEYRNLFTVTDSSLLRKEE